MIIMQQAKALLQQHRKAATLATVLAIQMMIVVDVSIVNVALPVIQRDLGVGQAELAWVLDGYLIAFGSFLLVAGRLGDLLGRKRVLLGGLSVFVAASALCGLAPNVELLVGARVLQGLGPALMLARPATSTRWAPKRVTSRVVGPMAKAATISVWGRNAAPEATVP
jgi:MFS family permease